MKLYLRGLNRSSMSTGVWLWLVDTNSDTHTATIPYYMAIQNGGGVVVFFFFFFSAMTSAAATASDVCACASLSMCRGSSDTPGLLYAAQSAMNQTHFH